MKDVTKDDNACVKRPHGFGAIREEFSVRRLEEFSEFSVMMTMAKVPRKCIFKRKLNE